MYSLYLYLVSMCCQLREINPKTSFVLQGKYGKQTENALFLQKKNLKISYFIHENNDNLQYTCTYILYISYWIVHFYDINHHTTIIIMRYKIFCAKVYCSVICQFKQKSGEWRTDELSEWRTNRFIQEFHS